MCYNLALRILIDTPLTGLQMARSAFTGAFVDSVKRQRSTTGFMKPLRGTNLRAICGIKLLPMIVLSCHPDFCALLKTEHSCLFVYLRMVKPFSPHPLYTASVILLEL